MEDQTASLHWEYRKVLKFFCLCKYPHNISPCNYTTQDFYPIYSMVLGFCISDFWSLVYYIFMCLFVLLEGYFSVVSCFGFAFCFPHLYSCQLRPKSLHLHWFFLAVQPVSGWLIRPLCSSSCALHWVISLRLHVFFPFPVSKLISDHLPKGYSWCSWMYFLCLRSILCCPTNMINLKNSTVYNKQQKHNA